MCDNIIVWNGIDLIVLLIAAGAVIICGIILGISLLIQEIKDKIKSQRKS